MTINEYQQEALRTDSLRGQIPREVIIFDPEKDQQVRRLEQGLMGLCGEAGEAIDILKKHLFQGHDFNTQTRQHLLSELGDVAWYLAVSADALGYTLEEVLRTNIVKLRERYPNGFDSERSINRVP